MTAGRIVNTTKHRSASPMLREMPLLPPHRDDYETAAAVVVRRMGGDDTSDLLAMLGIKP